MKVDIGVDGLRRTWPKSYGWTTPCHACQAPARIGFVGHEGWLAPARKFPQYLHEVHEPTETEFWPIAPVVVAVYFCPACGAATAEYFEKR